MSEQSYEYPTYRWAVIAVAFLIPLLTLTGYYIMPIFQQNMLDFYGISVGQWSLLFTLPHLLIVFIAIPNGLLGDRFGVRSVATVGMLILAASILLRNFEAGFIGIAAAMVLFGIGEGLTIPLLPKVVNIWFPDEQRGLASGIWYTGIVAGIVLGLNIAPRLPGWKSANYYIGITGIVLAVVFWLVVRDSPPGKELEYGKIIEGAKRAVRSKNAQIAGIGQFLAMITVVSVMGEFPGAMNKVYGIPVAAAGFITSVIAGARIIGGLSIPNQSDKYESLKLTLFVTVPIFSIAMYLTWITAGSKLAFLFAIIAGASVGAVFPLLQEVPSLLPEIDDDPVHEEHVGGASGVVQMWRYAGGFVGLPYILMPIMQNYSYSVGWIAGAIIFTSIIIPVYFLDEPTHWQK